MQSFLNDVPLVVEVARQKSFSRAAEILGIGASTLSRRIKLLEERMGVLLFYRDTRNVEPTDNGLLLLERCEFILEEANKAYEAIVWNMQNPAGLLRIGIFRDLYDSHLKQGIVDFAARWPDIRMDLSFVEHAVDMRTDPYDVAFLMSPFIAPPLVARKLMTIKPLLYASADFLARHQQPQSPKDLHQLPCIVLERFGNRWPMSDGEREIIVELQPKYTFSTVEMCRDFCLAGHGVALLRDLTALPDEQAGRLVRVLPEWTGMEHDVCMVTGSSQLPRRVRLFVDHMLSLYGRT